MRAAWNDYYEIPPTRKPHQPPEGADYTIDEWWDVGIQRLLEWLFKTRKFDVFIVNYAWLSKAFEYAPPDVLKILDAHDQLAHRRHLLSSMGIAPEFFFTTESEEMIGFDRADLIWAIKEQERVTFSRYTRSPVVTVPHLDEAEFLPYSPARRVGHLNVGIVGSRNNINARNISEFFSVALPIVRHRKVPVTFHLAGSVCDLMPSLASPEVELRGRVDDMRAVYTEMDLVAVPMTRSTGLKVRIGEALAYGSPLISTAHAFEGYSAAHRFHQLAGMQEVSNAIVEVALNRSVLPELRQASELAYFRTAGQVERGLRDARSRYQQGRHDILLLVDAGAFDELSILSIIMRTTTDNLAQLGSVTVFVASGDPLILLRNKRMWNDVDNLVVSTDVVRTKKASQKLLDAGLDIGKWPDLVRSLEPSLIVLDTAPEKGRRIEVSAHILLRPEVASLSQPIDRYLKEVQSSSARALSVALASSELTLRAAEWSNSHDADCIRLSTFPNDMCLASYASWNEAPKDSSLLLLSAGWNDITRAVYDFLVGVGFQVTVVSGRTASKQTRLRPLPSIKTAKEALDALISHRLGWPEVGVDISGGQMEVNALVEVLERRGIPCLTLQTGPAAPFVSPPSAGYFSNHFGDLAAALLEFLRRPHIDTPRESRHDRDGGWESFKRRFEKSVREGVGTLPV
jgi:hypothetical protein